MKVLTPGHKFELLHTEDGGVETLQFVEVSETSPSGSVIDGTYETEVIEALIDRAHFFADKTGKSKYGDVAALLEKALKVSTEIADEDKAVAEEISKEEAKKAADQKKAEDAAAKAAAAEQAKVAAATPPTTVQEETPAPIEQTVPAEAVPGAPVAEEAPAEEGK